MSFRLVPKSVTFNDLERHNELYLAFFFAFFAENKENKHLIFREFHVKERTQTIYSWTAMHKLRN